MKVKSLNVKFIFNFKKLVILYTDTYSETRDINSKIDS